MKKILNLKLLLNMSITNPIMRIFLILTIAVFSLQLTAQEEAPKKSNLSIDLVLSGGSSTMVHLNRNGYSRLFWNGVFENKRPRFTQVGFDIKKRLRRNTLKTGIHLGTWSYMIEGHTYLPVAGFFPVIELSPETTIEKVKFQRISIPLSFVIEAKNTKGLKIDHEIGLFADLYFHNNIARVRHSLNGLGEYETSRENPFSVRNNNDGDYGLRLFYGIAFDINDKISIGSSINMGGFIIGRTFAYDYLIDVDYSYHYGRYDYQIFEFGLSARYNIL